MAKVVVAIVLFARDGGHSLLTLGEFLKLIAGKLCQKQRFPHHPRRAEAEVMKILEQLDRQSPKRSWISRPPPAAAAPRATKHKPRRKSGP